MLFLSTKIRIIVKKTLESIVFYVLFIIFAAMNDVSVIVYTSRDELPKLDSADFFHGMELFNIYMETPRHSPLMAVAKCSDGRVLGQLLAVVRRRSSWLPPFFMWHCRIVGEGCYFGEEERRDELFGLMMAALVKHLPVRVAYVELSHSSSKMFGYKALRLLGFFPVSWMNIHNSLHSKTPEERINEKMLQRIDEAMDKGVHTRNVETEADFKDFMRLLKAHNFLKIKRFIPDEIFFRRMAVSGHCRLLITRYRNATIGCCAYAISRGNAYLWYAAFLRKSYLMLHPADVTIWNAIKQAYDEGCKHFCFLDVGLPYRANKLRDFLLKFGGKPISAFRWFKFRYGWINNLLARIWSL